MNPGQEMIKLYAKQLRLPTLAQIDDLIRQAEEQGLSYADFLGQVLQREIHQREENQQRLKIRKAKFPLDKSLDTFDLSRLTQVEDALIWQLATGEFVKHRENVIMIGNPGNGKTHLAIGLGRRMCSYGFAELLFHVLSERNERGSVIITTNLEFSRWTEIFPDTMLTAALVDRLTHRAHILDMNGPSYRLEQRLKKQKGGGNQG
ncbi:MAG: ATP-binding protein [Syntrophomonadaceae bacterium]|jgi:DNA replication protein DnaC